MTSTIPTPQQIDRQWLLIDADGQVLGRLASRIVMILRGKHKPTFTPFLDTGDFVVVINAEKITVTGQKMSQKTYDRYSGYPGGRRTQTMETVLEKHPDRVIRDAVKGMMPHGPLGRRLLGKLRIYRGAQHPHGAQQLQPAKPELLGRRQSHG